MKRAGAIIIGKTNTPEFGLGSNTYNDVFGRTLNAYDQTQDRRRIERRRRRRGGAAHAAGRRRQRSRRLAAQSRRLQQHVRLPHLLRAGAGAGPRRVLCLDGRAGPDGAQRAGSCHAALGAGRLRPAHCRCRTEQDPAQFAEPLKRDFKGARIAWAGDFGGYLPFEPGVLELCRSALKTFEALGCTSRRPGPTIRSSRSGRTGGRCAPGRPARR